ncbi:MAG: hypothetical protein OXH54_07555 [Acidimicrobiaceae bacterium]|nr:hypothetical protein [Acidimicrobiaceae bacterium]
MGADVAVVVQAVARTAVRPVDGELAGWNPVELAGAVGREALERAGLGAGDLDEVVVGCADPVGACGADAARAIVLAAGWPVTVGGMVVDRGETSGLAAVQAAMAAIRSGQARTVLVVGLGLCSVVPPGAAALNRTYGAPWGGVAERFADAGGLLPAPRLTERVALAAGIDRAALDAAAEESRRRRAEADTSPAIVAVAARPGDAAGRGVYPGDPVAADVVRDWGDPAELPPTFDDEGLLTAATFAPPADAVAAVLLQAVEGRPESQSGGRPAETTTPLGPPAGVSTTAHQAAGTESTSSCADPAGEAIAPEVASTAVTPSQGDRGSGEAWRPGRVLATVVGTGRAAGHPFDPVGDVAVAVDRALAEAGTGLDAVEDIAVVEHDASTAMLVAQALGVDAGRINRSGGAVATGSTGAAEELRLITDGLTDPEASRLLLTVSAGPTGSAVVVWRMDI